MLARQYSKEFWVEEIRWLEEQIKTTNATSKVYLDLNQRIKIAKQYLQDFK